MDWRRPASIALIVAAPLLVSGGRFGAAMEPHPAGVASPTSTPTATCGYSPGADSLSGRVIRLVPNGVVIETAGHEVEVSLTSVADVWKETSVPVAALEVGDDLFVNGTGGSPFVARYVYANIGRIDGVILAVDQTGMIVDVQLRAGSVSRRIDFSPYIEFGAPAANHARDARGHRRRSCGRGRDLSAAPGCTTSDEDLVSFRDDEPSRRTPGCVWGRPILPFIGRLVRASRRSELRSLMAAVLALGLLGGWSGATVRRPIR